MTDLSRQLDDEAAKRGVTFYLDSSGVILSPTECRECTRWGARPDHCEHVDHNVGVMVRCVLEATEWPIEHVDLRIGGHDAAEVHYPAGHLIEDGTDWCGVAGGNDYRTTLARLLLKLWEAST